MSRADIDASLLFGHGINREARRFRMTGAVDQEMFEKIFDSLELLNSDSDAPITMIFSSPGGDVDYGLAIYDLIRLSNAPVDVLVNGICHSSATLILCAGCERVATASSTFLVHHGDTSSSNEAEKKHDERVHRYWVNIIAARMNVLKSTVYAYHSKDTWFMAGDALKVGLIDRIVG